MNRPDYYEEIREEAARRLGANLKAARKQKFPRDSQDAFCRRIGVSRYTYSKMERGDRGVAIGSYLAAADLLGILDQVVEGFAPPPPPLFGE